jgi:hypothetical protein
VDGWLSVEQWWNDTDGKTENWDKNVIQHGW